MHGFNFFHGLSCGIGVTTGTSTYSFSLAFIFVVDATFFGELCLLYQHTVRKMITAVNALSRATPSSMIPRRSSGVLNITVKCRTIMIN